MKTDLKRLTLLLTTLFSFNYSFSQSTFTVTSTSKSGTGSILEAINLANNNPGVDTIEFTPGLQIDASYDITEIDPNNPFMLSITESVVIDGKGGKLNGNIQWVTASGQVNNIGAD